MFYIKTIDFPNKARYYIKYSIVVLRYCPLKLWGKKMKFFESEGSTLQLLPQQHMGHRFPI